MLCLGEESWVQKPVFLIMLFVWLILLTILLLLLSCIVLVNIRRSKYKGAGMDSTYASAYQVDSSSIHPPSIQSPPTFNSLPDYNEMMKDDDSVDYLNPTIPMPAQPPPPRPRQRPDSLVVNTSRPSSQCQPTQYMERDIMWRKDPVQYKTPLRADKIRLDAGRGPGLDAGRGPGLDAGRGPGLDAGRGPGLDAGRGPGLDAGRGPGLDAGRGPGLDAGRGPGRGASPYVLATERPSSLYSNDQTPGYNNAPTLRPYPLQTDHIEAQLLQRKPSSVGSSCDDSETRMDSGTSGGSTADAESTPPPLPKGPLQRDAFHARVEHGRLIVRM